MKRLAPIVLCALAAACGGHKKAPPATHHYTYRAVGGISMGGIGASITGGDHPDKFDAVISLGGPLDGRYMLRYMEQYHLGGFCPLSELEKLVAAGKDLNDPAVTAYCSGPVPGVVKYEHAQWFNKWRYTSSGGSFDRSSYLGLFYDLSLALGNPLYYNKDSPMLPPGVTEQDVMAGSCDTPVVVKGLYNKEYNPEGKYDAVSFCDGEEPIEVCQSDATRVVDWCSAQTPDQQCGGPAVSMSRDDPRYSTYAGAYDPCWKHTQFMPVALAVDLNGNGKRDYGEPILVNAHERFSDVGADGCPDAREDGKGGCLAAGAPDNTAPDPNKDNFDVFANPTGTEGDFEWEQGEPFEDDGLDGVPNTGDYGEGNGKFDETPTRENWYHHDAETHVRKDWGAERSRVDYYLEGGSRDVFNFGVQAEEVFSGVETSPGQSLFVKDFPGWPGANTTGAFDASSVDFTKVPRYVMFLYGNDNASPADIAAGDGDHVGKAPNDPVQRFYLMLRWVSHRWPNADFTRLPGNYQGASERIIDSTYPSQVLGADRDYSIFLPPGYELDTSKRYPVLYFMHGYGMDASGMARTAVLFDQWMVDRTVAKFIVVFVSGRCCFDGPGGARACTEQDATGNSYDSLPGWKRECNAGTFYANRSGWTWGAGDAHSPYEDATLELMNYVDAHYRTLPAADVVEK